MCSASTALCVVDAHRLLENIVSNNLSFQSLIKYFDNRVMQIEKDARKYVHGDAPQYPPFIVFLGKEAADTCEGVAKNLFELWPQYTDKICFVGMSKEDSGIRQSHFKFTDDGVVDAKPLDTAQLLDEFDELFADETAFDRMTMTHIYYVLDTSSIATEDEFLAQLEIIPYIKNSLQVDEFSARDSLILLLRSDMRRRAMARRIRTHLASFANESIGSGCDSVFLLSNYRNDGVMLRSWDECYRIAALFMALSNCENELINKQLFHHGVLTASYSIVQKPTCGIGQVVLDVFLRGLNDYVRPVTNDLLAGANIKAKLGITDDGTFKVIDDDAQQLLKAIVPTERDLAFFPRSDFAERDISRMSFADFDRACMGALSTYLTQQQKRYLMVDGQQKKSWAKAYVELLRQNFSVDELIYLGNHLPAVRDFLLSQRVGDDSGGVIGGAYSKLRIALSRNLQVIDIVVDQIRDEAKRANDFRAIWKDLLGSLLSIRPIEDHDLVEFYGQKVTNFLDLHGKELGKKFATQSSVDELRFFLQQSIDDLIDSDEVFSAQFEAELMQRLDTTKDSADSFKWIFTRLTGENLKTYLQINFALDAPVAKAVFVEGQSELNAKLHESLTSDVYFYNTGSNRWVEAFNVYAVDAGNLDQATGR